MLKHNLLNLQELIQATTAKAFQIERHELEAQPAKLSRQVLPLPGFDESRQFGHRHLDPSQVAAMIADAELAEAQSPQILLGPVDEICDTLHERRERWGVSYWVVAAQVARAFAPIVERLAGT